MDKKLKKILIIGLILGFLSIMTGSFLLILGSLLINEIVVYISLGSLILGFTIYVALGIITFVYYKRKSR